MVLFANSTLASVDDSRAQGYKRNKYRRFVLLCSNTSDNQIVAPFVIGKFKKLTVLKNYSSLA